MSRSWVAALIGASLFAMPPLALKVKAYCALSHVDTARQARIIDFLSWRGFAAFEEQSPDPQFFLIHARRANCIMDLREVSPRGYDRSVVQASAAGRRLFYVDNGAVSAEQPAWRTWSSLHFRRFAGFLGWPLPKRLTFAVTSNAFCADLDWFELSKSAEADISNSLLR